MTVLLTLSTIGTDATEFDLYSDIDGYTTPFEIDVTRASLLAGHTSAFVPDYTNVVRVQSKLKCVNFIDIILSNTTTTTTTV